MKPLAQYLRIPGARVVAERSGPESFITAVENNRVPLRHAPGMAFTAGREPAPQIAVFRDGADLQAISRGSDPSDLLFLAASPANLPYAIRDPRTALVLEAGTGEEVHRALLAGVDSLTAREADAQLVALMRDDFAEYSGALYRRPDVRVEVAGPRQLSEGGRNYDLIVRSLPPPGASQHILAPAYSLTVEAVQAFIGHLTGEGVLAFNIWIDLPPRQNLRLLSTAVRALEESGIAYPARHLAMFRGWQTAVLLVSVKPFSEGDVGRLKDAAKTLSLDAVHFPGAGEKETNRYHQLADDWFRRGAVALLGSEVEREAFFRQYPFRLDPVTDARPYPAYDGRWGTFFQAMTQKSAGGLALASPGLLILLATLAQATVLSGLIVLLPMTLSRRTRSAFSGDVPRLATVGYFTAVGVAFMFLEIVAIQRAVLLIGRPTYAVATVIAGFLVFAGLGAIASRRLANITGPYPLTSIALAIVVAAVVSMAAGNLLQFVLGWPLWGRLLATLALNAPLAFLVGMPFPAGLALLAKRAPALRPWAWGINGCASVIGAILAALTSIELGLDVATLIAMILYPAAAMARLD